jgi:DNA recombination protein RmuC
VLEALLAAGGLVLGASLGWLIARSQGRAGILQEREAVGARLAAAEALGDDLRKQLSQREFELGETRRTAEAERSLRVQAETRAEATRENVEEQRRLLTDTRERFREAFADLSARALESAKTDFLQLAGQTVDAQLAQRQTTMDSLVSSLREDLGRYEHHLRELETRREQAYAGLKQHLEHLHESSSELQREAGNLVVALRGSQVKGRWGELTLRRVVELAGMVEHCDYEEQVTVEGPGGRLRPDMIVHLPNDRQVIVDAKAPSDGYFDAMNAATEKDRREILRRHAQQVRQHMNALAGKAYQEEFAKSADFVVMFVSAESFAAAAAHADSALIEDGMAKKVVVATPTTLYALLRATYYGWQQHRLAENAEKVRHLGQELYERLRIMIGHLEDVGDKLGKATSAYNRAVGSLESRVLPTARRFHELGAGSTTDIPILVPVDEQPRVVDAPEVPRQLSTTDPPPEQAP